MGEPTDWEHLTPLQPLESSLPFDKGCNLSVLRHLFGRSIPRGRLIEIVGPAGSGKTNLAISIGLASSIQGCSVVIIDCSGAVSAPKLSDAYFRFGQSLEATRLLPPDAVESSLAKLHLCYCSSIWKLLECLASADLSSVDVVLLDGFHAVISPLCEPSSGAVACPDSLIAHLLLHIKRLCVAGCTVFVTNSTRPSVQQKPYKTVAGKEADPSFIPRTGPINLFLDAFDVSLLLSKFERGDGSGGSSYRFVAEILRRPPYYHSLPLKCEFTFADLFRWSD